MGRKAKKQKQDTFREALGGKKIPMLTLDNKWYKLLDEVGKSSVKDLEEQLNKLLQRQGKLNTESKDIRKLKKKLMGEIVQLVDEMDQTGNGKLEKKIDDTKRLIEECNEKLDAYQDELKELPKQIDEVNYQLMVITMEYCYATMQNNLRDINETSDWVTQIRVELKKRLIRKQEMEKQNQDIYSYMHDIFGADIVNLFDLQYNSEEMN